MDQFLSVFDNIITVANIGIFANIATAFATTGSLYVAIRLLEQNIEPDVIIYAHTDNRQPSIIFLCIENVGNQLAQNISFDTDKRVPQGAFGIEGLSSSTSYFESSVFQKGMATLAPKDKRLYMWGQYGGLKDALEPDGCITFKVTYFSRPVLKLPFRGLRKHQFSSTIDIESFSLTCANLDPLLDNLRKMTKSIDAVSVTLKKLS